VKSIVLILGGSDPTAQECGVVLSKWGHSVVSNLAFDTITSNYLLQHKPLGMIVVSRSPQEALSQIRRVKNLEWQVPTVLLTPDAGESYADSAWEAGADRLFYLPVSPHVVLYSFRQLIHRATIVVPNGLIGCSEAMCKIRNVLAKVAATDCNVLITGETGTGKELIAESIHTGGQRCDGPFQCVNCAAIPDSLLESELFGYERGAFTGAHSRFTGQLQMAEGGTLFLDEVGELSLVAQAKVLRAIETRNVKPLGSTRSLPVNVRVVAATNRDLEGLASEGKFRHDLLFRLQVAHIYLAPLRERQDDIPLLAQHFIRQFNNVYRTEVRGLTNDALDCLQAYPWPGNVRELKNLLESVFVMQPGRWIVADNLPPRIRSCSKPRKESLSERDRVQNALDEVSWNKTQAASKLHWSRMTVYRKIVKYNIKPYA